MPAKGVFPTRENCDPNDPEEAFLWMFAALPGTNGGQLIMPIDYFRKVSKRLWDCGCRPTEEPTLEYVPPTAADANWATSAGSWVEAGSVSDTDKQRAAIEAAVARMGHQQKVEFFKALQAWESGAVLPDTKAGQVVGNMVDSEPHLLPITLAVLRAISDAA